MASCRPTTRRRRSPSARLRLRAAHSFCVAPLRESHAPALERLTEPPDLVEADEGAAEGNEGEVDVLASLGADGQASQPGHPGVCALDHPAVPPQTLAALDATPRDTGLDATGTALRPATAMIIALVGMQPVRPSPRAAPSLAAHAGDRVQGGCQHHAVVAVGPAQEHSERRAAPVDNEVALRPWLATIRGVRARRRSPPLAGTVVLSSEARLQSSCPAASRCSSSTLCRAAHTPACCQACRRRQQVMPEPHPISAGRCSQGNPVRSTKSIPVRAARSGIGGRPPRGRGRAGGSSGAMNAHRSSGTRAFAISLRSARKHAKSRFC